MTPIGRRHTPRKASIPALPAPSCDKLHNTRAILSGYGEMGEAISVLAVLKEMGTPTPPMDAHAKATLATLKASEGAAFDKAYITAELGAHEFLRDLSETYLKNSAGRTGMAEMHGRHLSMLALAAFKEHIVHCKNIKAALQA